MFLIVPMLYTTSVLLRVYQIFIYGDEDNIFKISFFFFFFFLLTFGDIIFVPIFIL
ncbi:unnamed protein product [Brassica oleracea]